MKIKTIFIFSHDGRRRDLEFKTKGLNVITGKSSTGKSELPKLVEFCMGRSSYLISGGILSQKSSWVGVVYAYPGMEVLVAKRTPKPGAKSMSKALLLQGNKIDIPKFEEMSENTDDDSIIKILSQLVGIPENKTEIPFQRSTESYRATIQHTYFYLFQKQNIICNEDLLFYRQSENFLSQTIIDTLPILLGISSDDKFSIEAKLRDERRNLKIYEKQIKEALHLVNTTTQDGLSLLQEARALGMIDIEISEIPNDKDIVKFLERAQSWSPEEIPDTANSRVGELEHTIEDLREKRQSLRTKLKDAINFSQKRNGFSNEINEQKAD